MFCFAVVMQEQCNAPCASCTSAGLAHQRRDAPAVLRARLYSKLTPPTLLHQLVPTAYAAAYLATTRLPQSVFPYSDVMASFGGAGLGQKVIKPNPYVAAFSIALRQTYLFLGFSLPPSTSANPVFHRPERGSFPLDHDGTAHSPAPLPVSPASLPAAHQISATDATFQASART